jgi:hypothetical protein
VVAREVRHDDSVASVLVAQGIVLTTKQRCGSLFKDSRAVLCDLLAMFLKRCVPLTFEAAHPFSPRHVFISVDLTKPCETDIKNFHLSEAWSGEIYLKRCE